MKKLSILGTLFITSLIFMLLLTSCRKTSEPIASEEPEEESASLMVENSTESVEVENGIEEKEEKEKAAAKKAEDAKAEAERIAEEEIINLIIEENQNMIKEFLMNPEEELKFIRNSTEGIAQIWIQMSVFDFIGDGKKEIMLSKQYVTNTWKGPISYNYVYNQDGNKLFEFLSGSFGTMTIYTDKNSMECYLCSKIRWGEQNDTSVYTKVVKHEDWEKEVNIGVWDTRKAGQINPEESYCIFHISPEAEQDIFEASYIKMAQIALEEEWRVDERELEEYLQSFEELEEDKLDYRGVIIYIQDKFIMNPNEEDEIILWGIE